MEAMKKELIQELAPVLDYIEKHYTEKILISELCNIIHVCDDKLTRLFKKQLSITPRVHHSDENCSQYGAPKNYQPSLRRNCNYVRICKQQLYDPLF